METTNSSFLNSFAAVILVVLIGASSYYYNQYHDAKIALASTHGVMVSTDSSYTQSDIDSATTTEKEITKAPSITPLPISPKIPYRTPS